MWYEPKRKPLDIINWPMMAKKLKGDMVAVVQTPETMELAVNHGLPKSKVKLLPLSGISPGKILAMTKDDYDRIKRKRDQALRERNGG